MDPNETYTPMKEPKYCFVPACKNNSRDTQKVFFAVPTSAKQEWCNAVGISCPKRAKFICEDHLNLEEDMENYQYWIATKGRPKLKSRLPHSLVMTPISSVHQEIIEPGPSTSSSFHSLCENPFTTKASKGVQVKPRTSDRTTYCAIYKKKLKKHLFKDDEIEEVVLPSTQGSSTSIEIKQFRINGDSDTEQNNAKRLKVKVEPEHEETSNEDCQPKESVTWISSEEFIIKDELIVKDEPIIDDDSSEKDDSQVISDKENMDETNSTDTAPSPEPQPAVENHLIEIENHPNTLISNLPANPEDFDLNKMLKVQQEILANQGTLLRIILQHHNQQNIQNKELLTQIKSITDEQKHLSEKISTLSIQLDEVVTQINTMSTNLFNPEKISAKNIDGVKPIDSVDDLNRLEVQLSDQEDKNVYLTLKNKYVLLCFGEEVADCANRLVDAMFTRKFIAQCSWMGSKEEKKIPLKRYKHVLSFFWEIVYHWNQAYSPKDNELFFKSVILNAGIRTMPKNRVVKND